MVLPKVNQCPPTVLIDDAYLGAIFVPTHVSYNALVSVVDHLLVPESLVEHPHDDESILITGGEAVVSLIPRHHIQGPSWRRGIKQWLCARVYMMWLVR